MVTRKRARTGTKKYTRKRARTGTKKYMIVVETKTEKRGLTWDQAQTVKSNLNKRIGRRKGTVIKVVPY